MKRWFADDLFRSVLKNSSYLGAAKIAGAPLGLVALALAGRGLSLTDFGLLMVINAYAEGVGNIAKFQTWQVIIRYGGPALAKGDKNRARDAIRFAFGLDISSGLAGLVGALIVLPFLAPRLGLSGTELKIAFAYCTIIPTMQAATATGILRVLDRFDLIGVQQVVMPFLRGTGAILSFVFHWGFAGFVATWYLSDILGDMVTWFFAVRELRRREMSDALRPRLFGAARNLPDGWSFVWLTNIGHSMWAAWGSLSNLVVAAILGPASAGLYKIASTLLDGSSKPADLLARGFYPEIMRLDPASKAPWRLALRTSVLAAGIGLVMLGIVWIGGKPLIGLIFGKKYLESFDLLKLMVWSLAISMAGFPLESLLYMVGRQRAALVAQLLATATYLGILAGLTMQFGLIGAGFAYLIGTAAKAGFALVPVLQSYRNRRAYSADNVGAPVEAEPA